MWTAIAAGVGWGLGWWLGGSHEWGWRCACLAAVVELGAAAHASAAHLKSLREETIRLADHFAPFEFKTLEAPSKASPTPGVVAVGSPTVPPA